jgi:hypothetical protein
MDANIEEIWKDVVGHEGLYQVSNHGRVKSFRDKVKGPKILSHNPGNKNDYPAFFSHGERILIHRALMIAFCPVDGYERLQVNHKDANKKNNHISNLEWTTAKGNAQHARALKIQKVLRGSEKNQSKFTESDIPKIRELSRQGLSHGQIASRYNVNRATITKILLGIRWKHVGFLIGEEL